MSFDLLFSLKVNQLRKPTNKNIIKCAMFILPQLSFFPHEFFPYSPICHIAIVFIGDSSMCYLDRVNGLRIFNICVPISMWSIKKRRKHKKLCRWQHTIFHCPLYIDKHHLSLLCYHVISLISHKNDKKLKYLEIYKKKTHFLVWQQKLNTSSTNNIFSISIYHP